MGDPKKKASERLQEFEAEGISSDEARVLLKYEIQKGTVIDDTKAVDVGELSRDAEALAKLLAGTRVNKGKGVVPETDVPHDEPDGDEGADGEEPEDNEDEDEDYGDEGGGDDEPEDRAFKARRRNERREEDAFIKRMAGQIRKAMSGLHRQSDAKIGGVEAILKAQGRLAVKQAGVIDRLSKALSETQDELKVLKSTLARPEGTFKAQTTSVPRAPMQSPYDTSGPKDEAGVDYESLSAHIRAELRKANDGGDHAKVAMLKGLVSELTTPGSDMKVIAKRAGFAKA